MYAFVIWSYPFTKDMQDRLVSDTASWKLILLSHIDTTHKFIHLRPKPYSHASVKRIEHNT